MSAALRIIRSAHHSIEAAPRALGFFVDSSIRAGNPAPPDPCFFHAPLQHIDVFAERLIIRRRIPT